MRTWNNNFDMKRNINGNKIIIGQQDFVNGTIMVKEENGNIIDCYMALDSNGDIYFIYDRYGVYISNYLGEFKIA